MLFSLAFPRPGWAVLAHVALVPMTLLAAWSARGKRVLWTSLLVAIFMWLYLLRWLWPVTGGGNIGLAVLMASYTPAYLLVWRCIHKRFQLPAVLTVPLVYVTFEFIRGTFVAGGFGWFGLGHSQAPWHPDHGASKLIQVASIGGEWAISFVVAMSSGVIVDLIMARTGKQHAPSNTNVKRVAFSVGVWLIVFGGAMWYGQQRIQDPFVIEGVDEFAGDTFLADGGMGVAIAVVQTNVPQSNKIRRNAEQLVKDFNRVMELTLAVAQSDPKPSIILLPETVTPWPIDAFSVAEEYGKEYTGPLNSKTVHEALMELAQATGCYLVLGSGRRAIVGEGKVKRWNAVFVYEPTGQRREQSYSKMHRVPFGEYIPWVEDVPWLKSLFFKYFSPYGEDNDYTLQAGEDRTVFEFNVPLVKAVPDGSPDQFTGPDGQAAGTHRNLRV
ncbi:unnamed protein product, partial [marine sediment metagenome]